MISFIYEILYRIPVPMVLPFEFFFPAADRRWEEISRRRHEHAKRRAGCSLR